MRVLLFSHTYMSARYRGKLRWLATEGKVDLTLVAVPTLRLVNGPRLIFENTAEPFSIRLPRPLAFANHNALRVYRPSQIISLFREFNPDIVNAEAEPHSVLLSLLARLKPRFQYRLVGFTWENIYRRGRIPLGWLEPISLNRVDWMIAGNEEAGEVARWRGYRGGISIIPQVGFDPEQWSPSAKLPNEYRELGDSVRIGFAGRLVEEKGVLDLLEAFRPLADRAALIFLGEGPLRTVLRERASENGMANRVKVLGFIPHHQILAYLKNLDILVLPSHTTKCWKEQFGHALVEGMLAGVPVIGSNSGAIPKVISDAGIIFPEGNVTALREQLLLLIEHPDERARVGNKGKVRAMRNYTDTVVAQATLRVYEEVLTK